MDAALAAADASGTALDAAAADDVIDNETFAKAILFSHHMAAHVYIGGRKFEVSEVSKRLSRCTEPDEIRAVGMLGLCRSYIDSSNYLLLPVDKRGATYQAEIDVKRRLMVWALEVCPKDSYVYSHIAASLCICPLTISSAGKISRNALMWIVTVAAQDPAALPATRTLAIYAIISRSEWSHLLTPSLSTELLKCLETMLDADPTLEYAYLTYCFIVVRKYGLIDVCLRGRRVRVLFDLCIIAMQHIPCSVMLHQMAVQHLLYGRDLRRDQIIQQIRQLLADTDYHPGSLITTFPVEYAPPGEPWTEARHAALDRHYPLNRLLAAALLGMERLRAAGTLCRSDPDMWGETFGGLTFADTVFIKG